MRLHSTKTNAKLVGGIVTFDNLVAPSNGIGIHIYLNLEEEKKNAQGFR